MYYKFLSECLRIPADLAVKAFLGCLEPIGVPEGQYSAGKIRYEIQGKMGTYEILFMYPIAWDTTLLEQLKAQRTLQRFYEKRGEEPPFLHPSAVGFVTKLLQIWNILICFRYEPFEKGLVDKDLLNEMLDILVEKFKSNLK